MSDENKDYGPFSLDKVHLQWFTEGDGDGTPTLPTWMSQLPDDLKKNEQLSQFGTLGDFGKKYLEVSKNTEGAVKIPGEDATDEERAAFYNKIGRPEVADKYELINPELPEGMKINTELGVSFRDFAHKTGLTQKQAKAAFEFYNNHMISQFSEMQKARQEAVVKGGEALKTEWGTAFDRNMEVVRRTYEKFGNEEFTKFMDDSGMGNNPIILKTFLEIGKATLDDSFLEGSLSMGKKREKGVIVYDNSPELYKK